MILVIHKKHEWNYNRKNQIYIGRPGPYGNPYKIGEHGTRAQVIAQFDELLKKAIEKKSGFLYSAYQRLKNRYKEEGELILVCWCRPQACHGDVWKKYLEQK